MVVLVIPVLTDIVRYGLIGPVFYRIFIYVEDLDFIIPYQVF